MSAHQPEAPDSDPDSDTGNDTGSTTGNDTVDAVLASLEGLEDRPVDEHVAVFEAAHDALRGALADAGRNPTGA